MNVIEMTRELGKLIQQDTRYVAYHQAREKNDKDETLQQLISDFNLKRMALNNEMQKSEKDSEKLAQLDTEIKSLYGEIMGNQNMVAYNQAKEEMDNMLSQINMIVTMSANGEDPETCPTEMPSGGCSGSCASCGGGCH